MWKTGKIASSCLAAAMLLCTLPAAAGAKVKVIQPEHLRPMDSAMDYSTSPMFTSMNAGTGSFFGRIRNLPVGARITGLSVWSSNTGGPAGSVTVYRVTRSELDLTGANDVMTVDLSTAPAVWSELSETSTGPDSNRVRGGDSRYFVRVTLDNTAAVVGTIRVHYYVP
jgi:hypothetical protein